jgi:hypothetical protein
MQHGSAGARPTRPKKDKDRYYQIFDSSQQHSREDVLSSMLKEKKQQRREGQWVVLG